MVENPLKSKNLSRRRALQIVAAVAAFPKSALSKTNPQIPVTWRGTALGADAAISLYHPNQKAADRLINLCVAEVRRLESLFSLFDTGSSISVLNREGRLEQPASDLVALLKQSQHVGNMTDGAFDVTVQPLWQLFARHFSHENPDPAGPTRIDIEQARSLVDYRALKINADRVRFQKEGMAITLNGIAQGFITDRVADLLKAGGVDRVLVDMGELRGVGRHPDERPWRIGLIDPLSPGAFSQTIDLDDRAVASSGGYGTPFGAEGLHHHLFDPKTGVSAVYHAGITVIAPTATMADALSTGFAALPLDDIRAVVQGLDHVTAIITQADGTIVELSS